jgi:Nuclease-related domain
VRLTSRLAGMDIDKAAGPAAGASELKRLRLRYADSCVQCATPLAKGAEARYDPVLKTVRCVSCPADRDREPEPPIDVGVAGASARREYERRVDSRESRVKGRFGRRLGGVILALSDEPQSTRAWARGSQGEQELAEALTKLEGARVLNDRRVPGTRGNIDHIVVAPPGVFVVDAKRYKGTIRIRDVGGLFKRDQRLYVGHRDCSKLADDMAWQVEAVERSLRSVNADATPPITPVLCFVRGDWPLLSPPDSFRGVRLEGTRSIKKLVANGQVLDIAEIDRLTRVLAAAFPAK